MAVRTVVNYPARVLKGIAGPIGSIGAPERELAQDLVDTMYDSPGCVGLAAPQLGVASRAFALDVSVTRADAGGEHTEATHLLSVYGADRPGIVAGVTRALADVDANIIDLETQVIGDRDEPVYAMLIELEADDDAQVATAASAACETLGVDHTLRRIDAETY